MKTKKVAGRPLQRPDRYLRNIIYAVFQICGPGVTVQTARAFFPWVARREIEDLLNRYRRLWRKKGPSMTFILSWMKPGTVWAVDHTETPQPIDGKYRYVLVVRDLASGMQLMALPVINKDLATVVDALHVCITQYGAPFVIKMDNAFDAIEIHQFADKNDIHILLSPPGLPRYNGAAEAGIGGLKTRAIHEAIRQGRKGIWNCDDLEAARLMGNELPQTWNEQAETANQRWKQRGYLDPKDRLALKIEIDYYYNEEIQKLCSEYLPGIDPPKQKVNACKRNAIARALVKLGFLKVRRSRITQLNKLKKMKKVS